VSDFVLDHSVTMRWCFDSGNHAYADQILDRLATGIAVAAVPPLWRYEVSSVLALRKNLPLASLDEALLVAGKMAGATIV